MRLFISSEEDRQKILEELNNRPHSTPEQPGWFTGVEHHFFNIPYRALGKTVSPFLPDDWALGRNDPNTQGLAAQLVEGASDLAPFWVATYLAGNVLSWVPLPYTKLAGIALKFLPEAVGLIYMGLSKKSESSKLHQYQGVDKETADALGTAEGSLLAGFQMLPVMYPFKSLTNRVASGAGINIAQGGIGRGLSSSILADAGYHEMAEHYKVFDRDAILLDGMLGAFFAFTHTKEAKNLATEFSGTMGKLIGDIKDGIHERVIHRHATRSSSIGLHTTYEAQKSHMDTLASTIKSEALGEHPTFDSKALKTIAENTMEDPHFQSHLPEIEPHPLKNPRESELVSSNEKFESSSGDLISSIDEHVHKRFTELEKTSPELAKGVHDSLEEELKIAHMVREKKLYQVAVDCFLRTGGIK